MSRKLLMEIRRYQTIFLCDIYLFERINVHKDSDRPQRTSEVIISWVQNKLLVDVTHQKLYKFMFQRQSRVKQSEVNRITNNAQHPSIIRQNFDVYIQL